MTAPLAPLLETLRAAAARASEIEAAYRREAAQRTAALDRERTFAFRRLNFMRAVIAAVAGAGTEEEATARAAAALCAEVGWDGVSEARMTVLERFAPVTKAIFAELQQDSDLERATESTLRDGGETSAARSLPVNGAMVFEALADFEAHYGATHSGPFWSLFDQYVPETSVVDF